MGYKFVNIEYKFIDFKFKIERSFIIYKTSNVLS